MSNQKSDKENYVKFQSIVKERHGKELTIQEAKQLWDLMVDYLAWDIEYRGFYGFEDYETYGEMLKARLQQLDWDYRMERARLEQFNLDAQIKRRSKLMEFFNVKANNELFVVGNTIFYEVLGMKIDERTKEEIEKIEKNRRQQNETLL